MPTKLFKTGVGKATTSWLFYFCFWLVEWAELGNVKSELPVRADMVLSRYAVKSYANVVLKVCRLYQSYVNRRFKAAACVVVWFYCRRPLIPVRFGLRLTVSQEASSSDGFLELCLSPDTVCLQSGFWSGWCRYLRLLTLARPFSAGKTMMEKKNPDTNRQHWTPHRVHIHCSPALRQRLLGKTSPLFTTTRYTCCFQIRDNATIATSTP